MRDKHTKIPSDSELLRLIRSSVSNEIDLRDPFARGLIMKKFVFYMLLLLTMYAGILLAHSFILFLSFFILYGLSALLFAFNFAHDCSHDTVFRNKRKNNLAFIAIYTMVGAHAEAWKHRHIHSHHFAPNVEEYDTDLQITGIIRVTPGSKMAWYHRFQHFYAPLAYTSYSLFWIFVKDFVVYFQKSMLTRKENILTICLSGCKSCFISAICWAYQCCFHSSIPLLYSLVLLLCTWCSRSACCLHSL